MTIKWRKKPFAFSRAAMVFDKKSQGRRWTKYKLVNNKIEDANFRFLSFFKSGSKIAVGWITKRKNKSTLLYLWGCKFRGSKYFSLQPGKQNMEFVLEIIFRRWFRSFFFKWRLIPLDNVLQIVTKNIAKDIFKIIKRVLKRKLQKQKNHLSIFSKLILSLTSQTDIGQLTENTAYMS